MVCRPYVAYRLDRVFVDHGFYPRWRGGICIRFDSVDRLLSKVEDRARTIKDERQTLTIYSYDGAGRLSSIAVAANNGDAGFGPSSLDPERAVNCINAFHQTAFGRKVQDLSYFSLTPANPNWQDNWWETAKIVSVKAPVAFLVRTASKTAATVGEWLYGGAAAFATLTDMTGTASCYGGMINPSHPNF